MKNNPRDKNTTALKAEPEETTNLNKGNKKLGKRLTKWVWFNFIFALVPLMLMILIRHLGDKLSFQDVANSSEVLFFSLLLSATSAGDAFEYRNFDKNELLFTNMWFALLFLALICAVLYGCLLLDTILDLHLLAFRSRLLYVSLFMAAASLVLSFATQLWIGKIEGTA